MCSWLIAFCRATRSDGIEIVSHQIALHPKRSAIALKCLNKHRFTRPSPCTPHPVPSDHTWEIAKYGRSSFGSTIKGFSSSSSILLSHHVIVSLLACEVSNNSGLLQAFSGHL